MPHRYTCTLAGVCVCTLGPRPSDLGSVAQGSVAQNRACFRPWMSDWGDPCFEVMLPLGREGETPNTARFSFYGSVCSQKMDPDYDKVGHHSIIIIGQLTILTSLASLTKVWRLTTRRPAGVRCQLAMVPSVLLLRCCTLWSAPLRPRESVLQC